MIRSGKENASPNLHIGMWHTFAALNASNAFQVLPLFVGPEKRRAYLAKQTIRTGVEDDFSVDLPCVWIPIVGLGHIRDRL